MAQQAAVPVPTRSGAELDVKGLNGGLGGDFVALLAWVKTLRDNFNNLDTVVAGLQQLVGGTAADSDNIINQAQEVYAFLAGLAEGTPFAAIINGLTQRLAALEAGASGGQATPSGQPSTLKIPLAKNNSLAGILEDGVTRFTVNETRSRSVVLEVLSQVGNLPVPASPQVQAFTDPRQFAYSAPVGYSLEYRKVSAPDTIIQLPVTVVNGANVGLIPVPSAEQQPGDYQGRVTLTNEHFYSGWTDSPAMPASANPSQPAAANLLPNADNIGGPGWPNNYQVAYLSAEAGPDGTGNRQHLRVNDFNSNILTPAFPVTVGKKHKMEAYFFVRTQTKVSFQIEPNPELHRVDFLLEGAGSIINPTGGEATITSLAALGADYQNLYKLDFIWTTDVDTCAWKIFMTSPDGDHFLDIWKLGVFPLE